MSAISTSMASEPIVPVAINPVEHDLGCPNDPDGENRLLEAMPAQPPPLVRHVAEFFEPLPEPEPRVCPACNALNNPSS